ncbi:hypothetical protein HK104_001315, partial [Borealophlyctis nickersoniae]
WFTLFLRRSPTVQPKPVVKRRKEEEREDGWMIELQVPVRRKEVEVEGAGNIAVAVLA